MTRLYSNKCGAYSRHRQTFTCWEACCTFGMLLAVYTVCVTALPVLQILQLSQHDKAITIYYHPNSFSSTQSIRSNLANCWRFTVALDTPEVCSHFLGHHSCYVHMTGLLLLLAVQSLSLCITMSKCHWLYTHEHTVNSLLPFQHYSRSGASLGFTYLHASMQL